MPNYSVVQHLSSSASSSSSSSLSSSTSSSSSSSLSSSSSSSSTSSSSSSSSSSSIGRHRNFFSTSTSTSNPPFLFNNNNNSSNRTSTNTTTTTTTNDNNNSSRTTSLNEPVSTFIGQNPDTRNDLTSIINHKKQSSKTLSFFSQPSTSESSLSNITKNSNFFNNPSPTIIIRPNNIINRTIKPEIVDGSLIARSRSPSDLSNSTTSTNDSPNRSTIESSLNLSSTDYSPPTSPIKSPSPSIASIEEVTKKIKRSDQKTLESSSKSNTKSSNSNNDSSNKSSRQIYEDYEGEEEKSIFPEPRVGDLISGRSIEEEEEDDDDDETEGRSSTKEESYRLEKYLGQGSFSKVYEGRAINSCCSSSFSEMDQGRGEGGNVWALKLINLRSVKSEEGMESMIMREIEVLRSINHPGIVRMRKDFDMAGYKVIVLERIYGGELFEVVEKFSDEGLRPTVIDRLMAEMFGIVGWMHSIGLIHQDLKLENILVTREIKNTVEEESELINNREPLIKLTDFGLSKFVKPGEEDRSKTRCGSEEYVSPEIMMMGGDSRGYDPRLSELWSIGVITFGLIRGVLPFVISNEDVLSRRRSLLKVLKVEIDWKRIEEEEEDKVFFDERGRIGSRNRIEELKIVKGFLKRVPEQRLRIDCDSEFEDGKKFDENDKRKFGGNVWDEFECVGRFRGLVLELNRSARRI